MKIIKDGFSLKNDRELELFFIGVGSAFAAKHNQTNFLIVKGGTHIMVDFGMTGPQALLQTTGLKPIDIETVLPTHSHADHTGGIECLALMNRYVGIPFMKKSKIKAIIPPEYQRVLWDATLSGGLENNELDDDKKNLSFTDYFDVIRPVWKTHQPREIFEIDYGGIRLEIFRTKHIPDLSSSWEDSHTSYGMMIDDRVFFSGDTRFDKDLIDIYSDAEIMFHDVQFFPGGVHASLEELKTLPEDIKKKMHLVHYADNWGEQDIAGFAGWTQQGVRYIFG